METAVKKIKQKPLKATNAESIKPLRKRGLYGILKGKIHYDDSVFNLD